MKHLMMCNVSAHEQCRAVQNSAHDFWQGFVLPEIVKSLLYSSILRFNVIQRYSIIIFHD